MLFTNLVQANLKTRVIGQQIEYFTRLESTNLEAWETIHKSAQSGTLILTDNQYKGKGRKGRLWSAVPDRSLTFSVIFFTELKANHSGWLPILSGLAIHQALKLFHININLKWPNDLMLDGKKLGGILCESKVRSNRLSQVVIGIGLNVNETKDDLDEILKGTATSMYIKSGKFYQRERVLAEILNHMEPILNELSAKPDSIRSQWEASCGFLNQKVQFHDGDEIVKGTFISLGEGGSAVLNVNGTEKTYHSGEIN